MSLSKHHIRHILSTVPILEHNGDLSFRYLAQGVTNNNYWIKLGNDEFVLRINSTDSNRLGIDRNVELEIMKVVSQRQLGPELLYKDEKNTIRICQWLPGNSWQKATLEDPIHINRLVLRLKQLHALPCDGLPVLNFQQRLEHYRSKIKQRHGRLPDNEHQLLLIAIELIDPIQHSMPNCLCHNDLILANILDHHDPVSNLPGVTPQNSGRLVFLDWEYAAVNHPLFELAVICRGNPISNRSQHYLLKAYLGDQAQQRATEFESWCWFYDYLSLLWSLVILPEDTPLPPNLQQRIQELISSIPTAHA